MGHTFEEHVGEVRIRLEAPSVAALFSEGARAFAELVCRGSPVASGAPERWTLTGRDHEGLLVALLDELVYRAEVEGAIYPEVEVTRLGARELEVSARRAADAEPSLPVKAATLHGLAIRETPEGASATVTLDV